jgi:hypothetical protein
MPLVAISCPLLRSPSQSNAPIDYRGRLVATLSGLVLRLFWGRIRWAVNPVVPHLADEARRRPLFVEALPSSDGCRVVATFLLLERGEKAGRVTARGDGRPGSGRGRRGGGASVPGWVGSGGVHVYGVREMLMYTVSGSSRSSLKEQLGRRRTMIVIVC